MGADDPFYYPLGGSVEFGEHSEDALRREFHEELGVSLENVAYYETYEDVFASGSVRYYEI
ncbi:NUDIX domain-containing protein [Haladaptatus caseinilyticus]|uniref:NUDIX domain-containing protein n=1 Tax=Haladaptatus caseinilyticus TaxID=2993314 RepID=UPI00224B59A2|nr:NUDIX domain-containing protein [Haladaptatus caseinilyticus]